MILIAVNGIQDVLENGKQLPTPVLKGASNARKLRNCAPYMQGT